MKNEEIKIKQIVIREYDNRVRFYGLGEDNKIYRWNLLKCEWNLLEVK